MSLNLNALILRTEQHMLGTRNPSDELRSELRKAQVQRVLEITPLMMMANAANALIIGFHFASGSMTLPVVIWCAVLLLTAITGVYGQQQFMKRSTPEEVGTKIIENITIRSVFLGAWWGILPIFLLYQGSSEPNALVAGIIAGMIGGGCVALSVIPTAMLAFAVMMAGFSTVGIAQQLGPHALTLSALLVVYTYVLTRGSYAFANSFAKTVSSRLEINENAETISILLNEYEEGARDWIWETDTNGNVTRGAEEFADALDIDTSQWRKVVCLAEPCKGHQLGVVEENYDVLRRAFLKRRMIKDVDFGIGFSAERMCWFEISGRPIFDKSENFLGFRGFAKNRTSEMQSKLDIAYLAAHDPMTGLLNRSTFINLVTTKMNSMLAADHDKLAVLYIDLDGFKRVNDSKGHAIGDALLETVAKRLRQCCTGNSHFARIGGDEFAALVPLTGDCGSAEKIAENIVQSMAHRFDIKGNEIFIGASVGISIADASEDNAETLISAADIALYHAKADGKGCFRLFEPAMEEDLKRMVAMREALEQTIDEGGLSLAFQPYFTAGTERLAGFEALARWHHPAFGDVPPAVFIPVAEEAGLIDKLGEWVLREACRVASHWPAHLCLAVNVSVPQFRMGDLTNRVETILTYSGLAPDRLELEITEAVFADDPDHVLTQIKGLKQLGISISLDDFGTGYSSLMYLINFPFDKLKIDQSFVKKAQDDDSARSVLTAIAELGRRLSMKTTIEGIEHIEQLALITELDCDFVQGYHFGRPLDMTEMAICIATDTRKMLTDLNPRGTKALKAV